ncbi:LOW QUALITY PROTEIN: hypothetical protein RJ639_018048 [Escallonia herrerae]|uniref:Uncharacterized protein n=1 Tax=Escallonia herrerae TaxID=1293975 RepID=A0AA88VC30_9ASTE|nr:LOW QUALITY PROTEIN: hypothetical protein RJ639_018048 [Escallonia herrerae]
MANGDQPVNGKAHTSNYSKTVISLLLLWRVVIVSFSGKAAIFRLVGLPKIAVIKTVQFDSLGHFKSSDSLEFSAADFALSDPCRVHRLCGPNSVCTYGSGAGKGCSCLPGFKMKNPQDWSSGCESDLTLSNIGEHMVSFSKVSHVELFGYESNVDKNFTLERCKENCSESTICKGFLFKFEDGTCCYAKSLLLNGKHSPNSLGSLYVKTTKELDLNCSGKDSKLLNRTYKRSQKNKSLHFLVWFTGGVGGIKILFAVFALWFMFATRKWCSYARIHRSCNWMYKNQLHGAQKSDRRLHPRIGRGVGGVLYKGVLSDDRIIAINRLNQASQGEAEFLAEVSTIGRLNHMNLIEMFGYCTEGKYRLLNGSLAENLCVERLNWAQRFEIAVGSTKGLAYLHEECLEWVLHCDVKPHNVLLDTNYQQKIEDFELSKILN